MKIGKVEIEIEQFPEGYSARVSMDGEYQFDMGGAKTVEDLFLFLSPPISRSISNLERTKSTVIPRTPGGHMRHVLSRIPKN